jgi:DNA-binding SARP family transcriptional activator
MDKEKFLKEQIKSYEKMHIISCEYVAKLEKDIKRLEKSLDEANELIELYTPYDV